MGEKACVVAIFGQKATKKGRKYKKNASSTAKSCIFL
jgi:hypothetical protein